MVTVKRVWTVDVVSGPLRECPNVLLTPRTARYSDQGLIELRQLAAEEMRRAVMGQLPSSLPHCVNAHMLNTTHSGVYNALLASTMVL